MNQINLREYLWILLALATILAPAAGCGGSSGPVRYDLEGAVLYDGKPVPSGEVVLQPDGSKGNAGPGSLTLIKDGRYKTDPNKGIVGGSYTVQILGYDGVPVADVTTGKSLFPPYVTQVDFPKERTKHDFNIPRAKAGR